MDSKPQSYLLVDTPQALVRLAAHLTGSTRLYLDTEFDKRKDRTIFCLLQIHNGEEVFLVDVQRLHNLEPLAGPLSQAEWVLHAGEQDVALLCQYLELPQAPNLFDTQIAWALLGPEHQVSLAYLLFRVLGLRSSKEHQVDDFTRRPLQPSMLNYAAEDVLHLPDLVDALLMRLRESAKDSYLHEVSREYCTARTRPQQILTLQDFRNAWQLDQSGLAVLQGLLRWYHTLPDQERKELSGTQLLFTLARRMPNNLEDMAGMKGVPRGLVRRRGKELLDRITEAARQTPAEPFPAMMPGPYATFHDYRVDAWLHTLRAVVCERVSIAPELALPSWILARMHAMIELRKEKSSILEVLEGWRARLLGQAITDYLQEGG